MVRNVWILVWALVVSACQPVPRAGVPGADEGVPAPSEDGVGRGDGAGRGDSAATPDGTVFVAQQPGTGAAAGTPVPGAASTPGAGSPSGAGASSSAPTDKPVAVDVGNPGTTGPKPDGGKSRLRLRLADAPSDTAQSVLLRVAALDLVPADGGTIIRYPLTHAPIDLLTLQGGVSFVVFDADVPAGDYSSLRLVLDPAAPATLVENDGDELAISVLDASGAAVLHGLLALSLPANGETDVTMHIDLRKALQMTPLGPILLPVTDTFLSGTRGALEGLALPLLARVACVYPSGTPAPTTPDCTTGAGSALVEGLRFHVAHLQPGQYRVRLFLAGLLPILDLPGLHVVSAGLVEILTLDL